MKIENFIDRNNYKGISGLFFASGDFGIIDSVCNYSCTTIGNKTIYRYEKANIALTAEFTEEENGVVIRQDYFENLSDSPTQINRLFSRFFMDSNSYEVYTQYNAWQHESSGGWQKLITQVTATSQGIRTCDGAAPIMALNNLYTGKNTVFHLLPNAQWKMTARKFPRNDKEAVIVETGFNDEGLQLVAKAGERIELPTVIFFNAESKTDLDAYKLHNVYNKLYPRKSLPVLYNSWLYCFDNLDVDALLNQVECAAELGFEAFMIDAGWFGKGENWSLSVGDWQENTVSGPKGRLIEISELVRKRGMIFGLWFEPERANPQSQSVKEHPEYYINNYFFDFSNPDAVDYMLKVLSEQIEKYSIGWLKFDFNDSIPYDKTGNAFYRYMQGQKRFIQSLRAKYPQLYITNCASGGYRMELGQGTMFDSFWLSDNQGSFEGLRIVKDTLKRMPSGLIERWNVQKYSEGFVRHGVKEKVGVMFTCNNATWDSIVNVDDSFTKGFLSGGPLGFSCDIDGFPPEYKQLWKEFIAQYKKDRDFFLKASSRILVDSEEITAIQYSDNDFNRIIIQLFTKTSYACELTVYPAIDSTAYYLAGENQVSATQVCQDGIRIEDLKNNSCRTIELIKINDTK